MRGQRRDIKLDEQEEPKLFSMGQDSDFEGLQIEDEVTQTYMNPLSSGRTINVNNILSEPVLDNPTQFDRDIGESSKEED